MSAESPNLVRPRVLVADDDQAVRALLEFHFRGAPWDTVFARDGAQAVRAFVGQDFDLVLLDLEMPVLGGEQAALEMRRTEAEAGRSRTVILALSAHAGGGYPPGRSFDGSLAKPFTRQGLLEAVHRALGLPEPDFADSDPDGEGTDPALRPLLPKLYDSVAELAADAAAGLERGDMTAVGLAGHKIRGAASCFGVRALSRAAELLEQAAENKNPEDAAAALDAMTSALPR